MCVRNGSRSEEPPLALSGLHTGRLATRTAGLVGGVVSLTREAFGRIREAIVSGALEFGEPLSETQIAKALGMSKAPVRAAFMELRDKGMVNIVPQSGTYVFSPTEEDVRMLSSFRALLEDEAVRVANKRNGTRLWVRLDEAIARMRRAVAIKDWDAYRKADSAFHHAFLEESENRYLLNAYHLGAPALEALRVRLQSGLNNFRERSFNEHIEIARLLRTGEVDEACAILRTHILIINDSLHTFPLNPQKGSRREKSATRNYVNVFNRTQVNDQLSGDDNATRPTVVRRSRQSHLPVV
jgi:DNA-binding GntR family transcriptional regulator